MSDNTSDLIISCYREQRDMWRDRAERLDAENAALRLKLDNSRKRDERQRSTISDLREIIAFDNSDR